MFNSGNGIVPVMNVNGNNDGMWGGDGGWWAWILFAMLFGWGGNGWGWGNGNGQGNQFTEAQLQRGFDNQAVISKLDGISNGICSLGYDQLAQMNGIQQTVQQTGWNLQQTANTNANAAQQMMWQIMQLISSCCCDNKTGFMNVINQMDKNNCAVLGAISQASQQQMWANQQGFRDISDQISNGFRNLEVAALNRENAELRQRLNDCSRDSALLGTANYIINKVNPCPEPAYLTCNPNTGNVFPQSGMDQWQVYNERYGNRCCQPQGCCNNF